MKQAFSCRRIFKIITLTLFLSSLYIWCMVNVSRNNVTAEIIYWIFSTGKLGWRPVSSQRLATCSCVPICAVMMFLVHFGESFNLFKVKKYDFDPGLLQCCEVHPILPAPWLPSWRHSSGYPFYLNGNECKTDDWNIEGLYIFLSYERTKIFSLNKQYVLLYIEVFNLISL